VKPSGTVVAEAIGATPAVSTADWEFACKAGTEALQAAAGYVGSGMVDYALAIGADTAQGRPGDALEYTTGAGAAALLVGPAESSLAVLEASTSFVSDTPDFWRRAHEQFPSHGQRFTGEPAYFHHTIEAARQLMDQLGRTAGDYDYVVLHQPNAKFPVRAARQLGFRPEQYEAGLLARQIGNAYAASSLLGMTAVLDVAAPGDLVLLVSFGSGAGSDAFSWRVTERLNERGRATPTEVYVKRDQPIDYATYARYRKKLRS
jgi:hydroxymethylglutaryl-CoA synthase